MRLALIGLLVTLLPGRADAVRLVQAEERWADLHLLLQPEGQLAEHGAPDRVGTSTEIYLRRARLVLSGQVHPRVTFFVDTDIPNFGKNGDFGATMYLQDAFVSVSPLDELTVDAGLMIPPFLRHATQGAGALASLDYHSVAVRFPAGSTRIWREGGVQLRSNLIGGRIEARAGAFNGVRGKEGEADSPNPEDAPMWAGHVRFNLLDAEPDFFYPGVYFGAHRVLSLGFAAEHQRGAIVTSAGPTDHTGLAADAFADVPVGDALELVAQAALVRYEEGSLSAGTGNAWFAEALLRRGPAAIVLSYERFAGDRAGADRDAWRPGATYYFDGTSTALKGEVSLERDGTGLRSLAGAPRRAVGTLQLQLFL